MSEKFDRFDLEMAIQNCWSIVDDLKLSEEDKYAQALSVVYDQKFQLLWRVFENLIANNQFVNQSSSLRDIPEHVLRLKFDQFLYKDDTSEQFNKSLVLIQDEDNLYFSRQEMQAWMERAFAAGVEAGLNSQN